MTKLQLPFGLVLVCIPRASKVNRKEHHRVGDAMRKGYRVYQAWWLLYGQTTKLGI